MIKFSVKHPIPMLMFVGILLAFGFLSLSRLELDFFPKIEFPTVTIITTYENVAPEDIEESITKPIENVVSTVSGVKKVSSVSREGISMVMVEFEWGTNIDFSAQDIRDRLGLIEDILPEDAGTPVVFKFDISQMPVIEYFLTSERYSVDELNRIVEDDIKGYLERIDGVASCDIVGGKEKKFWVLLSVDKMFLYRVGFSDVVKALRMNNLNMPAGKMVKGGKEIILRSIGEFETPEEILNQVVSYTSKRTPVFLKDIGRVSFAYPEPEGYVRINGKEGVGIDIKKESGANTVKVVNKVKRKIKELKSMYPDIDFRITFDQGTFIVKAISRTFWNALLGALLAAVMIFIFLLNLRPTFVVSLSIPLSVIITFTVMYAFGYTLNIMTLAGIALGVGMLVDASIVVIENIFRHKELGEGRKEAAINGTSEVWTAISASTFTNIVVFLPLLYIGGFIGQITTPLAVVVSTTLLASVFVAITIVPMFSSLILPERYIERDEKRYWFRYIQNWYRRAVSFTLRHRKWFVIGALGLFIISLLLLRVVGVEFMPEMDRTFGMVEVELPAGTSLEETENYIERLARIAAEEPGVRSVLSMAGIYSTTATMIMGTEMGSNRGVISFVFEDPAKRRLKSNAIMRRFIEKTPKYKGAKVKIRDISRMFMGIGKPVEVKVYGKDMDELVRIADEILKRIKNVRGVVSPELSIKTGKPELRIKVNRMKASYYGLTPFQVENELKTAFYGIKATVLRRKGEDFDVIVKMDTLLFKKNLSMLESFPIKTPAGIEVPLSAVAKIEYSTGPVSIEREKQSRYVAVTADVKGRSTGEIMLDVARMVKGLSLPPGYSVELTGEFENIREMIKDMLFALTAAVLLIYMIMVAQFESFKDPFIVMFSLPLAVIGVVLMLLITQTRISVPSLVGTLILFGVSVNEAIVMITFIKQLRKKKIGDFKAVVEGSVVRLRPVLISGLTTILGMLPMAIIRHGHAAEMRSPLAIAMIGGLLSSMVLVLFVIPILYTYFEGIKIEKTKKRAG